MLADYARTDAHRLRRVEPVAQATRELAALVRARTSLVEARTAASKQLWAVLAEHWPGAAVVFQKLTSQVALAFLTDYPTPQSARLLGEGRMRQFCRRHSYPGGKSPLELLARLRQASAAMNPIAPTVLAAIVGGSVAHIRILNAQIVALESNLAPALAVHPKTALLKTLPRVTNVSLAALPAEIGPLLERCNNNPEQVAARPLRRCTRDAGLRQVPRRRVPPHRQQVSTRRDHRLRRQLTTLITIGCQLLPTSPLGARHPHAVRILARGWVRVLWACWTTDTVYDPSRHRGERLLATAT